MVVEVASEVNSDEVMAVEVLDDMVLPASLPLRLPWHGRPGATGVELACELCG